MRPVISMFAVRLQGGSNSREGRLEVFYDGAWRDVCYYVSSRYSRYSSERAANDAAARVVCSMLGFGYRLRCFDFDSFDINRADYFGFSFCAILRIFPQFYV